MSNDVLINLADGARMLGISARTFRRMVARGEIPVVRLSSKILRYRQSDIAAIVAGVQNTERRLKKLESLGFSDAANYARSLKGG